MGLYSDVTLSDSQYIPQYAGLPLDTVRDVADTLAERHYQNLARMDQLSLLAQQQKTQVLPGDRWYVDQQIGDIRNALGDIAQNGGENATARVAAIANRYMGDENILTSLQRAGDIQKEIDVEAQLRAAGKTPVRRQGARERFQAGIIDTDTKSILDETFRAPYQSTAEAFVTPTPEMEEIWKVVNPDAWYTDLTADEKTRLSKLMGEGKISPDMDMPLFFKTLRGSGISTTKIESLADKAYSSYKNQPSYRQQTGILGKSDAQLKNEMTRHGLLRVFNQVNPQYIQNSAADDVLRGSMKARPAGLPYEYVPGETIKNLFGYNPDDFDPNKKISTTERGILVAPANFEPNTQADLGRATAAFLADYKTAAEVFGGMDPKFLPEDSKNWSPAQKTQAIELVKKYQEMVGQRVSTPYRSQYDADQSREASAVTRLAVTGRTFYDMDSGEKIAVKDNKGRLKEEFSEIVTDPEKFVVAGKMGPKDPFILKAGPEFASAEYGQIWDAKNGHFKNVLITPAAGELESVKGNIDRNTAIVYAGVNLKPGTWNTITPSVYGRGGKVTDLPKIEARELVGNQFSDQLSKFDPSEQAIFRQSGMIIEAKVNSQTWHFTSPEHLSQYLLTHQ